MLPKTSLGKWSVWLSVFFILIGIFFYIFAEMYQIISSDTLITVFGATAVIAQIVAFILGFFAVIKHKDRSILVYIAILLGIVVLLFIFGDILGLPDI